jgi:hypothetical protein
VYRTDGIFFQIFLDEPTDVEPAHMASQMCGGANERK